MIPLPPFPCPHREAQLVRPTQTSAFMTAMQTIGAMKRFRRTSWKFQQTVQTPMEDLNGFVSTIVSAHGHIENAIVTIDQVVFDTVHLNALMPRGDSKCKLARDFSISTDGAQEVESLLSAAFADWIDFSFVPMPKPFVIYADHDEYVTFYANTKSHLNKIIEPLSSHGYRLVPDWTRNL